MDRNHVLAVADIVELKKPYRPEEWIQRKPEGWSGFEFGVVVEILAHQITVNGDRYGNAQTPRTVSLHLYDATGQLFIPPKWIERGLMIPEYVDFHVSELILYKIAIEEGYIPVINPPNWAERRDDEIAILQEFED